MIKKYLVQKDSAFNRSLILPFYEGVTYGFVIDCLSIDERLNLFNSNKVKGLNNLPTNCYAVYFDDKDNLKALVLETTINKKFEYYCLRVDPQKDSLRYQTNYKSEDVKKLMQEYEKSGPCKKEGVVERNFKEIKDNDFFKQKYLEQFNKQINKDSNISRLVFSNASRFLSDFARLVERKELTISTSDGGFFPTLKTINQNSIVKNRSGRQDCLLINVDTESIEYFIYTYKSQLINHYYLFKRISNKEYRFIKETTSFEQLFLKEELSKFTYKNHTPQAANSLANVKLDDFIKAYIEFKNDEQFDESFEKEWDVVKQIEESIEDKAVVITPALDAVLKKFNYRNEDGVLFFDDYEPLPLAFLERNYFNLASRRDIIDENSMHRISLKSLDKIDKALTDLLQKQLSSRVLVFEQMVKKVTKHAFSKENSEQPILIKEIEDAFSTMWPTDRYYLNKTIGKLHDEFDNWKKREKANIIVSIEDQLNTTNANVGVTYHAMARIDERIGEMSEEKKLALAKIAYEKGKTSVHYCGIDNDMFMFLQYKQNSHPDKTLRLYDDTIFIFSLKPPHDLITCFPVGKSFDEFMKQRRKK